MLTRLRAGLKSRMSMLIDGVEVGALVLGGGLSIVFGKLFAAVVFAAIAVGVASRFLRHRNVVLTPRPLPIWVSLASSGLAVVGAAIVVEAINLPIRFDQIGFEKSNLLIVVALILVFHWPLRSLFRRLLSKSSTSNAVVNRE